VIRLGIKGGRGERFRDSKLKVSANNERKNPTLRGRRAKKSWWRSSVNQSIGLRYFSEKHPAPNGRRKKARLNSK